MTEREHNPEQNREYIPTPEEVQDLIRELSGKESKETKRIDDEKGLLVLEVEVAGESVGQVIEYAYQRNLRYLNGAQTNYDISEIHKTTYEDGMPVSGTSVARVVNGEWKIL